MKRLSVKILPALAILIGAGCEPTETQCDGCDGEMEGGDLCVVTLGDMPEASGDSADAGAGGPDRWESAPWQNARWLSLPGGGSLKVQHDLGRMPTLVQLYLSFEKDDSDREGTRSSFPAAGDLAHITGVSAKAVMVENNTDEDFCLRLVLE
jgi:hypothetical protein